MAKKFKQEGVRKELISCLVNQAEYKNVRSKDFSPGFGDLSPHYKLFIMGDLADIILIPWRSLNRLYTQAIAEIVQDKADGSQFRVAFWRQVPIKILAGYTRPCL
ncbi:MAG: hypothetical protein ACYTXC_08335, partial [Nostoc sp.]